MKKRILLISTLALIAVGVAACQGGLPPFYVVVVVSPTPDPNLIQITVTPPEVAGAPSPTADPNAAGTPTPSPTPTEGAPLQAVITATPPGPTPTLSAFPTETRAELYIAQQDFEHGYMFWISTQKVIWVLLTSPDNPDAGEWRIYQDTYVDTEPEIDPTLTPPTETLYQPRRGFGKLWRETPGLRDALGWATTPELALNTVYVYQPGGTLDANGNYISGPGRHFLTSLGRETFVFIESATGASTWQKVN